MNQTLEEKQSAMRLRWLKPASKRTVLLRERQERMRKRQELQAAMEYERKNQEFRGRVIALFKEYGYTDDDARAAFLGVAFYKTRKAA